MSNGVKDRKDGETQGKGNDRDSGSGGMSDARRKGVMEGGGQKDGVMVVMVGREEKTTCWCKAEAKNRTFTLDGSTFSELCVCLCTRMWVCVRKRECLLSPAIMHQSLAIWVSISTHINRAQSECVFHAIMLGLGRQ